MNLEVETSDSEENWNMVLNTLDDQTYCTSQLETGSRSETTKYGHERTIVHIDIDCFYAQVEMLRRPELRDKPLGIQQKNIIVTCNYVARKEGVSKLMYLKDALVKCPQLQIVNGEDLTHYREVSYKITGVLAKYSDKVERLGFDENFVDVSKMLTVPPWNEIEELPVGNIYGQEGTEIEQNSCCKCGCVKRLTRATHIASEMRRALFEELGITSCAGVGHNKLLAKLVGETHKPNQQTVLYTHFTNSFLLQLEKLRKIPGIGHKTCDKLAALGIHTLLQLQNSDPSILTTEFGQQTANSLVNLSRGIDDSEVVNTGKPQSMSDEDSFQKCTTVVEVKAKIAELLHNLLKRLQADGRLAQTLRLSVRKLVPGVKYPNRQSKQCPITSTVFSGMVQSDLETTHQKLCDMSFKLFEKIINTSEKFHLTLINICFANLVEKHHNTSDSKKAGTIDSFFKSGSSKQSQPTTDASSKLIENRTTERIETVTASNLTCRGTDTSVSEESITSSTDSQMNSTNEYATKDLMSKAISLSKSDSVLSKGNSTNTGKTNLEKHSFFKRVTSGEENSKSNTIAPSTSQRTHNQESSKIIQSHDLIVHDEEDNCGLDEGNLHRNVTAAEYRFLVRSIGCHFDINTFLELPSNVQEDIVLQYDNVIQKETLNQILNIVKNCSSKSDADPNSSVCDPDMKIAHSIGINEKDQSCISESDITGTSAGQMLSGNCPLRSCTTQSVNLPPGMDPSVFRELPPDVQKNIINEWKTSVEFETMRKRKLRSPDNPIKSQRRKLSDISGFFKKK